MCGAHRNRTHETTSRGRACSSAGRPTRTVLQPVVIVPESVRDRRRSITRKGGGASTSTRATGPRRSSRLPQFVGTRGRRICPLSRHGRRLRACNACVHTAEHGRIRYLPTSDAISLPARRSSFSISAEQWPESEQRPSNHCISSTSAPPPSISARSLAEHRRIPSSLAR